MTSVAVVPQITNIEPKSGAIDPRIFRPEETPLEKIFDGKSLSLAPPPAPSLPLRIGKGLAAVLGFEELLE